MAARLAKIKKRKMLERGEGEGGEGGEGGGGGGGEGGREVKIDIADFDFEKKEAGMSVHVISLHFLCVYGGLTLS